jgi:16S rRNA (cytidine1402-2'-O)-methyltransferase
MVKERAGVLYVVSTPIGNMGDFSFRGVDVLRNVSLVLAEDTRRVRKLLNHFGIAAAVAAHHAHNEARSTARVLKKLGGGDSIALVSDAGTPLVSDPGERLVCAAIEAGLEVTAVPGASALLNALVLSGLPTTPFTFLGFLPRKGRERQHTIAAAAASTHTTILFEAANRLVTALRDLGEVCGAERACAIGRELTKLFEEMKRGTLAECAEYYEHTPPRGEVVIVIGARPKPEASESSGRHLVHALRKDGLSTRDIVTVMVEKHGVPRNVAYRLAREDE